MSWLQGVPGHDGLPGQPGLTAELVGTGQISLPAASPTLLGAEFATPAPLASVGVPLPSLFPGWEKPGCHVAPQGFTWCPMLLSRFSRVQLCVTPETAAHQAPPSLGFSRQEHWSGLPCPPPGDLPEPGIKPKSHVSRTGRQISL